MMLACLGRLEFNVWLALCSSGDNAQHGAAVSESETALTLFQIQVEHIHVQGL